MVFRFAELFCQRRDVGVDRQGGVVGFANGVGFETADGFEALEAVDDAQAEQGFKGVGRVALACDSSGQRRKVGLRNIGGGWSHHVLPFDS